MSGKQKTPRARNKITSLAAPAKRDVDRATKAAQSEPSGPTATTKVKLDLDGMTSELQRVGGSKADEWNDVIASQASNSIWKSENPDTAKKQLTAVVAGLWFIKPEDELEGMLAAQLMASHNAAMECYRRAMIPEQPFLGRSEALTQANKLSRTYATLLEALNRHRGKGQQRVTVEHVHVHEGGQAVVGVVGSPGGGVRGKIEG